MAFKMRGKPVISGTNDHRSALQYKQQADAEYESALKKLSAKQKQMDVNNNDKIDAEDLAALRQSPNNANMSPADANYGSPADANYGSPADANMGDSPNKFIPIVANVVRAGATRFLPAITNVARTQTPKLLRNVTTGFGSVKDKVYNVIKKTVPHLISYGAGSYAGSQSEKTKQKAKENVKKNQPKTNVKTKPPKKIKATVRTVDPYSRAKKNDPNLDSYIRERSKHRKGSAEYNALQNKINAAYGVSKRHTVVTSPSSTNAAGNLGAAAAAAAKGQVKKSKIQSRADKRKGEVDENVARKTTKRAYKTTKKSGTAQEKADAKVKMLEAKLADYEGAKGGKKRVLFGNYLRKRTKRKLDEARQEAGSPANFGPGKVSSAKEAARKAIQRKLETKKKKKKDAPINFGPSSFSSAKEVTKNAIEKRLQTKKKKKKATTAEQTKEAKATGGGVGRILKSESEKAKMKAAGVGRKN